MEISKKEKIYWIAVIIIATAVWSVGVWSFYLCDVRSFCFADVANRPTVESNNVIVERGSSITIAQSASVVDAIAAGRVDTNVKSDTNRVNTFVPVAERPVRYR